MMRTKRSNTHFLFQERIEFGVACTVLDCGTGAPCSKETPTPLGTP